MKHGGVDVVVVDFTGGPPRDARVHAYGALVIWRGRVHHRQRYNQIEAIDQRGVAERWRYIHGDDGIELGQDNINQRVDLRQLVSGKLRVRKVLRLQRAAREQCHHKQYNQPSL